MKKLRQKPTPQDLTSTEDERLIYYDKLHFIPLEFKDELWAAEVLYFNRKNSIKFVNTDELIKRRKLDNNIIDEDQYKKMVDPDGKAEYYSADWKGNPIFIHLNNIVDSKVEKIPNNILVKAVDEFSKSNLQKENERILGQKEFRNFINEMNKKLGFPPIKENEDPFSYVSRIQKKGNGGGDAYSKDMPIGLIESLKSAIEDNEDLQLFNEYLWKDGVEIACELGIKYYMDDVNKFYEYAEDILGDIRRHNKACLRVFTSETTGRPIISYERPDTISTSHYSKDDGSDITHWELFKEITFGDFIRMFGAKMTEDQLIAVFERARFFNGVEGEYHKMNFYTRNNAKIRIGYMEFESQDMEVYTEYVSRGNPRFDVAKWDYYPSPKGIELFQAKRVEKHYNVWRSFYYIPKYNNDYVADNDFVDQSKFIFGLKKIQDQQREGDDFRYAKSSLVLYSSKKITWFEIMNEYMPQIHLLWNQIKNDIANAHPHGLVWVEEFLTQALSIVDSDKGQDGPKLKADVIARIKQTGSAIAKMLDSDGKLVAGGKPFVEVTTGHMQSVTDRMEKLMMFYTMMTRALGISEASEGVDPKPRTSFGGVQAAMEATSYATYFLEKYYGKIITQTADRLLYYIKSIVDEKDSLRLKEFQDVVGKANGMALESVKDIPMRKLGLSVANLVTDEQKSFINNYATQMASAGTLDMDTALYITMVDNLKYAYAILRMKMKQKMRQDMEAKQAERDFILAQKDKDIQLEGMKQQAAYDAEYKIQEMKKQYDMKIAEMDNVLKQQGQEIIKDKIKNNKIEEKLVDHQLQEASTDTKRSA